jgi:hypothetical protein
VAEGERGVPSVVMAVLQGQKGPPF